jgi:hypothetical protein
MLHPGDNISMAVSHHVTINSDEAWIKLEMNRAIQNGETEQDAFESLNRSVQKRIIEAIESTAAAVMAYEEKGSRK